MANFHQRLPFSGYQNTVTFYLPLLTNNPILAYPHFNLPFVLHTDASSEDLGAVLFQKQGGKHSGFTYGSRTLTTAEKNDHFHSGWSFCFEVGKLDYLYYALICTVHTDNNPLTYVLSMAKLKAVGHRRGGQLADFHFIIKYRPHNSKIDANILSPHSLQLQDYTCKYTEAMPHVVSAVWQGDMAMQDNGVPLLAALQIGQREIYLPFS